jgi:hypothetical protein
MPLHQAVIMVGALGDRAALRQTVAPTADSGVVSPTCWARFFRHPRSLLSTFSEAAESGLQDREFCRATRPTGSSSASPWASRICSCREARGNAGRKWLPMGRGRHCLRSLSSGWSGGHRRCVGGV